MGPKGGIARKIAAIANRQHGLVTRAQLLEAGVTEKEIRTRVENGLLLRVHQGVYRVGHQAPSREAIYLAAVLACGDGALLSGRAAGHLNGILKGKPPPPEVSARTLHRRRGVQTRRRTLHRRDASTVQGIPVTSVPRTLVDLAAELTPGDLARACHEAGVRYRTTPRQVKAVLARVPNARGAQTLRDVMSGDTKVALSRLEERFLQVLREAGLPLPETNRPAGAHRVDCRWPEHRLTVELQSYRYHNSRYAWEQDHQRRREARARGDEFGTYTWDDVEHPRALLRELRQALSGRAIAPP
jgi:putative AbiEi antitoxin of type IV toxin-antitoxin system